MCGVSVCRIFVLPLVARCLETIDVCIWRMSVWAICRKVCCVADVVDSVLSLECCMFV